jgi:hypothetical protein
VSQFAVRTTRGIGAGAVVAAASLARATGASAVAGVGSGGGWKRIPLRTAIPAATFDNGADIAVHRKAVYLLWSATNNLGTVFHDKLYASTNGVSFSARPDPCVGLALTQAVPTSKSRVDLLCANPTGGGQTTKAVYRSTDTGKKDSSAGEPPGAGDYPQLAASPSGDLAVSSSFAASYIFTNDTGKTLGQVFDTRDGGHHWTLVQL